MYGNNNPSYLRYTMSMISMFTLTLTNEKHYWFDNMKEAHDAMWTCMRKDVQFSYMERFIRVGSKAHTSFLTKVSKHDFFKKLEEKEDVPFETRLAIAQKSREDDLNQSSEIITEKKLIVKEINNQPDILDQETEKKASVVEEAIVEKEAVVSEPKKEKKKKETVVEEETVVESKVSEPKPKKEKKKKETIKDSVVEEGKKEEVVEEEASVENKVSEPKPKKEKKKKEAVVESVVEEVVEEASVESKVSEPKPKKEKKNKDENVQLCSYILSRGDRRGQECQKQCVSGKDKCKLHDK